MVKVETDAPALWRKLSATAIRSTPGKRVAPRLYRYSIAFDCRYGGVREPAVFCTRPL